MKRLGRLVTVGIVTALVVGAMSSQGTARTSEKGFDCGQTVSATISATPQTIELACQRLAQERGAGADEVPTLFMAWPTAGFINDAGEIGYPVSGVCIYTVLAATSQSGDDPQVDGRHIVVGSGQAIGPAASTTIKCEVNPIGLFASATLIGPVAIASNTKLGPIGAQVVCTTVIGRWLDGSSPTTSRRCSDELLGSH